jgi:PRC-barrel domain
MGGDRRAATQALARTASALFAMAITVTAALADGAVAPAPANPAATPPANPSITPPASPSTTPPAPPQAIPEMTVLNTHEVEGILGREVRSAANEDMGRIVDVLVDRTGQVRAAIIDFGGFLGVGSRKIAVDWNALHFPAPGKPDQFISLELTRDQVKAAPEYQDGKPVVVLGALGKLERLPYE